MNLLSLRNCSTRTRSTSVQQGVRRPMRLTSKTAAMMPSMSKTNLRNSTALPYLCRILMSRTLQCRTISSAPMCCKRSCRFSRSQSSSKEKARESQKVLLPHRLLGARMARREKASYLWSTRSPSRNPRMLTDPFTMPSTSSPASSFPRNPAARRRSMCHGMCHLRASQKVEALMNLTQLMYRGCRTSCSTLLPTDASPPRRLSTQ
mmetsp:Transcript_140015/g.363919  ORF Transcript_140015/g.363919 Transcript_140015/m.363919 type:complete len:206 (-) Transcript_140015:227-844(-)